MPSPSVGPNYASTCVDDATVGTQAWASVTNAQGTQDNVYANASCVGSGTGADSSIKLVKGGTIGGNNNATGAAMPTQTNGTASPPTACTWVSYGSTTDLWGQTWTPADINLSTFGFAVSCTNSSKITHYLKSTNYGFSVLTGSTILGIKAEVCWDYEVSLLSFPAGVEIATPHGPKRIEDIRMGDQVFAFTANKKTVTRKVTGVKSRISRRTIRIKTRYGEVETTPEHQFFTLLGWIEAKDLKPGDKVFVAGMRLEEITETKIINGKKKVYNFSVSGSPTYFANGFAVHNGAIQGSTAWFIDATRITVSYLPAYDSSMMWRRML